MIVDLPPADHNLMAKVEQVRELDVFSEEQKEPTLKKVVKSSEEWKAVLTDQQYYILRKKGTERAFSNSMHSNKKHGIYHCAGCNTALFSSDHKFDSGTGWPSYFKPIQDSVVDEKSDNTLFMKRTEIICAVCNGHLGHVFNDGPAPTFQRYCINGTALVFKEK